MKTIITISLLILSTIFYPACKKDVTPVKGDWKWIYSTTGGYIGGIVKPSDRTTVSLTLDSTSIYTVYLNNQTNAKGSYNITSSSGISTIHFDKAISVGNLYLYEQEGIYQMEDSLFLINSNIEAAPTSVFIKVK